MSSNVVLPEPPCCHPRTAVETSILNQYPVPWASVVTCSWPTFSVHRLLQSTNRQHYRSVQWPASFVVGRSARLRPHPVSQPASQPASQLASRRAISVSVTRAAHTQPLTAIHLLAVYRCRIPPAIRQQRPIALAASTRIRAVSIPKECHPARKTPFSNYGRPSSARRRASLSSFAFIAPSHPTDLYAWHSMMAVRWRGYNSLAVLYK